MASNVVTEAAKKDIREFMEDERRSTGTKRKVTSYSLSGKLYYDSWDVSIDFLFTKENKALNKELGLIGLNSYKK